MKYKLVLLLAFFSLLSIYSSAQKNKKVKPNTMMVLRKGDTLFIGTKFNAELDLLIQFSPSMFNQLMTFSRVGLAENKDLLPAENPDRQPESIFNETTSDNIGPMEIENYGWLGANHSYKEAGALKTAKMNSFSFQIKGKEIEEGKLIQTTDAVQIIVHNQTLYPSQEGVEKLDLVMSDEIVNYIVEDGNVLVHFSREFMNNTPITVKRYYGAQSMGQGDEVLFVNGESSDFIPKVETQKTLGECPLFNRFIQRKADKSIYEAVYLLPNIGLGNHQGIKKESPVYISAYKKLYHAVARDKKYSKGDRHEWSALYSWFQPLLDNQNMLMYRSRMNGRDLLFIEVKQELNGVISLPQDLAKKKKFNILEQENSIKVSYTDSVLALKGEGSLILEY